jgi:ATP-dependent Clp protease ATP-binding subunit ClpC
MYERFTDQARKVMKLSNDEARCLNHMCIGTEHILLGLVKEGSGVSAQVLKHFDIDLRKVRLEVEKLVKSGPDMVMMGKLPMTPATKRVIEYAMKEAAKLNRDQADPEHILLGLLRENMGVAAQILMNLGLRLESRRTEIENFYGRPAERQREPFTNQAVEQPASETAALPAACPKCGQPVVRVIWRWIRLFGKILEDVNLGRAILGSPVHQDGPSWVRRLHLFKDARERA